MGKYILIHAKTYAVLDVRETSFGREAVSRLRLACKIAAEIGGILAGSTAALLVNGLPRLPKNADILWTPKDKREMEIGNFVLSFRPGRMFHEMDLKVVRSRDAGGDVIYIFHGFCVTLVTHFRWKYL